MLDRFLFSVPVGDFSTQINSLDLLYEGTNYIELFVAHWSHTNKVQVNSANDIFTSNISMLFCELFVAQP